MGGCGMIDAGAGPWGAAIQLDAGTGGHMDSQDGGEILRTQAHRPSSRQAGKDPALLSRQAS